MSDRTIRILNDLAEIARVDAEVAQLLSARGSEREFIHSVNLGLEEVLTNIIKYGYDDDAEHWIEIRLSLTPSELRIVVVDEGRAFDPLQHPEPDRDKPLEYREPGGLGVSFFRRLFDELHYQRESGKNVLLVRKRLPDRMGGETPGSP